MFLELLQGAFHREALNIWLDTYSKEHKQGTYATSLDGISTGRAIFREQLSQYIDRNILCLVV